MQNKSFLHQKLRRTRQVLGIVAPFATIAALGVYLWQDGAWLLTKPQPAGVQISGRFSLVDDNGRAVTDRDYNGRWRLVIFGYTRCPDITPKMLHNVSRIMTGLGFDAPKVIPLFVSIDPNRDKPRVLKNFVLRFYPGIVGLTGSAEQISDAATAFGIYYGKTGEPKDSENYLMDHSAVVFLMDTKGEFKAVFSDSAGPEEILADIQRRL